MSWDGPERDEPSLAYKIGYGVLFFVTMIAFIYGLPLVLEALIR